jgi:hypothetical protein
VIQQFNLDTRRDILTTTADLNDAGDVIPLVVFDPPEDMRAAAKLTLIAMGDARASSADFGWQNGTELATEMQLEPGGRATLAVRREWLSERVAVLRTLGGAEGQAKVELPFSTVLAMPRAPRASQKRIMRVAVAASASKPTARLLPLVLDIDALSPAASDGIARIEIDVPTDIVFEENRTLVLDLACGGFAAECLDVVVEPGLGQRITLRHGPATGGTIRRFVTIDDPADMAGQLVRLQAVLDRQALLGAVDGLIADGNGTPAPLRVTARLSGWGDGATAGAGTDRRFVLPLPVLQVPVQQATSGKALIAIGDAAHAVALDAQGGSSLELPPVPIETDPDTAEDPIHFDGLKIALQRWPLGRAGPVEITVESLIGQERIAEPTVILTPGIDRKNGLTRQAHALLPFRALQTRLASLARARNLPTSRTDIKIRISLASVGATVFTAEAPVTIRRSAHRLPICIDLGASAISIWSGQPHAPGSAFDLRPLAIGSWLASNVDPDHEEALSLDGEAAILIPSHVSLDPLNQLRSDHAPHTLADMSMIGPDRDAARSRMSHYGRRYDVSVPAPPPIARSRTTTRRITGIKRALATGQLSLTLPDPVNRFDATDGRLTQTTVLDVAPLVADIVDEIIDLYVMRLGQENAHADPVDPPPVAPRIVITCPSGIGDEITGRYELVLDLVRKRLERLFPGSTRFADAASVLPEAIAAARYTAELLKPQLAAARDPVLLITLDLGGSTSDVALVEISAIAGRVDRFRPLTTFGLPLGGHAIDDALKALICHHADAFLAADTAWSAASDTATLTRALTSQETNALPLQQWLSGALQRAKANLADALVAKADAAGTPFRWDHADDEATLSILLTEENASGWSGLLRPIGNVEDNLILTLSEGASIALEGDAGARRLCLRLTRMAVEDERMPGVRRLKAITTALGQTLQRMARAAVPAGTKRPSVIVVPTGRAALWPPLFETLAMEATAGRDAFPFARPLDPATMKKAVVAGAALLTGQVERGALTPVHTCPVGIAAMGVHLVEGADGTLRTGNVAERVYYATFAVAGGDRAFAADDAENPSLAGRVNLGQRFQFVRAVPGLDPAGHILSSLRDVLDHADPLLPLDGDITVDAKAERLDRFGVCDLMSSADSSGRRKITIAARDRDWKASWLIEGDRVSRLY